MTAYYRQPGEVADYTPTADTAVGAVVRIGLMQCGIASTAIAANTPGAVALEGVYELPKNTSDALTQGAPVWWDPTALEAINAPVTGSLFLGFAFEAAGASATTALVQIEEFDAEPARVQTLAATGNQALAIADFLRGDLTVFAPNTGAITLSLPALASVPLGAKLTVVKTTADAAAITLDPNASETIAGGASYASIDASGDNATFANTGATWALVRASIAAGA